MNEREEDAGLAQTPGYRYADSVDGQLFVAGQVPLDPAGDIIGLGDPAAQATACLDNLRTLLDVHGFAVGDVRSITVHVVGERTDLLQAWSAVTDWFRSPVPPATLLGARLLGHEHQLVEIDANVVRRAGLQASGQHS
jgi:enamine deaminase RidA (YjgF/YER057c/UK114 family)